MPRAQARTVVCPICREPKADRDVMHGEMVHGPVVDQIRKTHAAWSTDDVICLRCLNHLRADYVQQVLEAERGELSELEAEVVRSLQEQESVSQNVNIEFDRQRTLGDRLADRMAEFGGSWRFISLFAAVLVGWIAVNSVALLRQPFDPYPYILLNLVLSCLAAIQAPIIMMSQNRQEAKDRMRAEHDYQVNLKAELEIRHLHWKMDQLLRHQWQRLLDIQQIQLDLMEELVHKPRRGQPGR
jgi:uncharacterized membrane protein